MEAYKEVKLIGRGNYGSAVLVKKLDTSELFVIKKISIFEMSTTERDQAKQEVVLLANLRHPCIVRYEGSFIQDGHLHIVMQYCENGDLGAKIRDARKAKTYFDEGQILSWFTQLAMAVAYIHRRRILHRDLKSSNVFLARDNMVRLGDFGIARVLAHTLDQAKTVVGTPYYMSPEVCADKHYGERSDVWALGCVLYEMATLQHPFQSNNLLGLVHKIVNERQAPLSKRYSPELAELVDRLLQKDPALRPDAADILKMGIVAERVRALTPLLEADGGSAAGGPRLLRMPEAGPAEVEEACAIKMAEAAAAAAATEKRGGAASSAGGRAGADATTSSEDPRAPSRPPPAATHGGAALATAAAVAAANSCDLAPAGAVSLTHVSSHRDEESYDPAVGLVSPAAAATPVLRNAGAPSAAAAAAAAMSGADYGFSVVHDGGAVTERAERLYNAQAGEVGRHHLPSGAGPKRADTSTARTATSSQNSGRELAPSPVAAVAADLSRQRQQQQQPSTMPRVFHAPASHEDYAPSLLSPVRRGHAPATGRDAPVSRRSSMASDDAKSAREDDSPRAGRPQHAAGSPLYVGPSLLPGSSPTAAGGGGRGRRRSGAEAVVAAARATVSGGGAASGSGHPHSAFDRRASQESLDGGGSVSSDRRGSFDSGGSGGGGGGGGGGGARAVRSGPAVARSTPQPPLPPLMHANSGGSSTGAPPSFHRASSGFEPDAPGLHPISLGLHPISTQPAHYPQQHQHQPHPPRHEPGGVMSPPAAKPHVDVAPPGSTRVRSVSGSSAPGGSLSYRPSSGGPPVLVAPVRSSSAAAGTAAAGGATTTSLGTGTVAAMSTVRTNYSDDGGGGGGAGGGGGGGGGGFSGMVSPRNPAPVVVRRVSKTAVGRPMVCPGSAGSVSRAGSAGSACGSGLFSHRAGDAMTFVVLEDGDHHTGAARGGAAADSGRAASGASGRPSRAGGGPPAGLSAAVGVVSSGGAARMQRALSAVTEGSMAAEVPEDDDDAAPALTAHPPPRRGGGLQQEEHQQQAPPHPPQHAADRRGSGGASSGATAGGGRGAARSRSPARGAAATSAAAAAAPPTRHTGARDGGGGGTATKQRQPAQGGSSGTRGAPPGAAAAAHKRQQPATRTGDQQQQQQQQLSGRARSLTAESYAEDFDLGEPEEDEEEEGAEGRHGGGGEVEEAKTGGGGGGEGDMPWDLADSEEDDGGGGGEEGEEDGPPPAHALPPSRYGGRGGGGGGQAGGMTRGGAAAAEGKTSREQPVGQGQRPVGSAAGAARPKIDLSPGVRAEPASARIRAAIGAAPLSSARQGPLLLGSPAPLADIAFTPGNTAMTRARCVAALGAPAFERVYSYLLAHRGSALLTEAAKRDALSVLVGGKRALLDACGLVESLVSMEARARG